MPADTLTPRSLVFVRRAKEKRLKKDAGRTRWGQYFRSMKAGVRGDKRRGGDDDKSDADLDADSRKCSSVCM
ncbi:LIM/homeobox protein Lhx3 [Portunus trituberculatus]|uniref:LIM/homeobox protein Lhx3 n=1 Tax=Portunus trituberculatus TaxID=210409 RepID=A0A5B7GQX1_PORTR|nr:LIM/homeobox protein Lhx3 [Portunus trituberculatus]